MILASPSTWQQEEGGEGREEEKGEGRKREEGGGDV